MKGWETMSEQMTAQQLKEALDGFSGTGEWFQWSPLFRTAILTEGAKFLADNAKCYWLMDLIASHQLTPKVKREEFQVWELHRVGRGCSITCDDGNHHIVARQDLEYTDFPLEYIKLYAIWDGSGYMTILLPGEY